jgi:hypothetical protein
LHNIFPGFALSIHKTTVKLPLTILFFVVFTINNFAQQNPVLDTISAIYNGIRDNKTRLYVFNEFKSTLHYEHKDLIRFSDRNDSSLVKEILANGKKSDFTESMIKQAIPSAKMIGAREFMKLPVTQPVLTKEETKLQAYIDQLVEKFNKLTADGKDGDAILVQIDSLWGTPSYSKLWTKKDESHNVILCIHPYYVYKNYILVSYNTQYQDNHSYLFVKIIRAAVSGSSSQ